jgi:hypothetical protein
MFIARQGVKILHTDIWAHYEHSHHPQLGVYVDDLKIKLNITVYLVKKVLCTAVLALFEAMV